MPADSSNGSQTASKSFRAEPADPVCLIKGGESYNLISRVKAHQPDALGAPALNGNPLPGVFFFNRGTRDHALGGYNHYLLSR